MPLSVIVQEVRGPVGWIRLNRPEVLNALDAELVPELEQAIADFAADPRVRVLVITGTGRAFSAGGDVNSFSFVDAGELDGIRLFMERAAACLESIPKVPKPVIAALNGVTAAGGLEIAMACDLVIAAESARIGDAHVNFGLIPGAGGAVRLARAVGPLRAKYLVLTGELYPAEYFLSWGLVHEVVPDGELEERVQARAEQIATKSPLVLAQVKSLVDESFEQTLDDGLRAEREAMYAHLHTRDLKEGLAAFAEKRAPRFNGS